MVSESQQPSHLRLIIIDGPAKKGSVLEISSGLTIGRSRGDIKISDPKMSSLHGLIMQEAGGGYVLLDQDSANGTFVNNERVTQVHLAQGVEFRLGQTVFLVESTAPASTAHYAEQIRLDPKFLKGFEALEAKRNFKAPNETETPPEEPESPPIHEIPAPENFGAQNSAAESSELTAENDGMIHLKPVVSREDIFPATAIFQLKPTSRPKKEKLADDDPAADPHWRENLAAAVASLGLKRKTSTAQPDFAPFDLPIHLKFIAGVETDRSVMLGFGPREVGTECMDIELMEIEAPAKAFRLIPSDGRVLFTTEFPHQVLFNESPTRETLVNEGDVIRIGNTRILIQFVLPQRNLNEPL